MANNIIKARSKNTIIEIFTRLSKSNIKPTTQLQYNNSFELLIAVILSARTKDAMVNKVTSKLFLVANTPEKIISLTKEQLEKFISSIGLFRIKANNIIKTSTILVKKFNSIVPASREELQSLPGVGRKTANVLLNTLYQQPTIAVDTHVLRVANKIGLINTNNVLIAELQLLKIIPKNFLTNAHNWLIMHGRKTCTARNPKCNNCIIADLCNYNNYKK